MFELARLGFLLLGLYLALSPLDDLAGSLITVDGEKLVAAAIAIPIWLVLAFVPGLVLIWKSRALAERLFGPPEDGSGRFEAETVLWSVPDSRCVGCGWFLTALHSRSPPLALR